jgi:hypothetical protein
MEFHILSLSIKDMIQQAHRDTQQNLGCVLVPYVWKFLFNCYFTNKLNTDFNDYTKQSEQTLKY